MTIKEVETQSGMERANIRFYEREGLVSPTRLENGYRDYVQEDLQILLRIKLLRSLRISLEEIKRLKAGSKELSDTLSSQIARLERERQDAFYAQDICRMMQQDHVNFWDLDAKKYLDQMGDRERGTEKTSYFEIQGDTLSQVYYPWRRFLARMLDLFLYRVIWSGILAFGFHVNLAARSHWSNGILDWLFSIVIMLFLEPLLLHLFGTTVGKIIFGLRLENLEGGRLSYSQGLYRTWGVIGVGMGYGIPIYHLYRLWKSYVLCKEEESQPWDVFTSYSIRDTKWYRSVFYVAAYAAVFILLVAIFAAQLLPPNRGDLTIAEFVENYHYYANYFGMDLNGRYLDENGEWVEMPFDGTVYIDLITSQNPQYVYTVEEGYVTGISFISEWKGDSVLRRPEDKYFILAALAFAGAQKEAGLFSKTPVRILQQVNDHLIEDFYFTEAGISFAWSTEYSGAKVENGVLVQEEESTEVYFKQEFSMQK